jgi:hypothetical protein
MDPPHGRVQGLPVHVTATFVTLLAATVPEPFVTVHVLPGGFVSTVTA